MGSRLGASPSAEGQGLGDEEHGASIAGSTKPPMSTRSRELIDMLRRMKSRHAAETTVPSSPNPHPSAEGLAPNPHVELSPGCTYGVQSRQILDDLKKDVDEVKLRLNGLIFLVIGAVVVDVVIKLAR